MTVKNVEKLEKSRVALEVEVGAEEFEAAVAKAYTKLRNKINVPGFRPGKAPRKMIEKLYGPEVFYSDAVDAAFPEAYEKAVVEQNLNTIGYPDVEMVGDVTKDGFTFKATVAVYPEVKLGAYKGVSAPKDEIVITDDDVTERLNQMAERNARLVSVEREAKLGDTAVIDFEGFEGGKPFAGGKGENHELELGSGSFVPGFEDQVIGMKVARRRTSTSPSPRITPPSLPARRWCSTSRSTRSSSRSCPSWTTSSPRTSPSSTPSRSFAPTSASRLRASARRAWTSPSRTR